MVSTQLKKILVASTSTLSILGFVAAVPFAAIAQTADMQTGVDGSQLNVDSDEGTGQVVPPTSTTEDMMDADMPESDMDSEMMDADVDSNVDTGDMERESDTDRGSVIESDAEMTEDDMMMESDAVESNMMEPDMMDSDAVESDMMESGTEMDMNTSPAAPAASPMATPASNSPRALW